MNSVANNEILSSKYASNMVPQFSSMDEAERHWLAGACAVLDREFCVVEIQPTLAAWLGTSPAQVMEQPLLPFFQSRFRAFEAALQSFFHGSNAFQQIQLRSDTGKGFYSLERARHGETTFIRLESVLPPASELAEHSWDEYLTNDGALRTMFMRLLKAEGQLSSLAQRWPGVIFSQRTDLTMSFASRKIEEITGIKLADWQRHPQSIWRVIHEADADEFQHQLSRISRDKQAVSSTFRMRNVQTGRVAYILEHRDPVLSENGLLLGYEGVWLDVTRQTIAEKRLSSAAWKETLAVLTMGLAHDFSNIMSGILSLSEAFEAQVEKEHPFQEGLALIKRNSKQASQLVHRILNLHQGKTGERNYYNLNELVGDMVELVRKIIPRRVEIKTELASSQLPIYVDAVEFRQVFINLTLNAVDAMPQGGKITFSTARHETLPPLPNPQGVPPRPPSVVLSVSDTGIGISPKHVHSLFDPFFTTKAMNKGSGLGLYNAKLFVEKHHGAIAVQSVEKEGATFIVALPEADFTEAERLQLEPLHVRRTLMVVGPPTESLDALVEFLRQNGYYVVVPDSEANGMELLRSADYQFAGVLFHATRKEGFAPGILSEIQRQKLAVKTILQVVGCNQDEMETQLLNRVDMVLPADLPAQSFLAKLDAVLQDNSSTP